jgi:hypothetical protein
MRPSINAAVSKYINAKTNLNRGVVSKALLKGYAAIWQVKRLITHLARLCLSQNLGFKSKSGV